MAVYSLNMDTARSTLGMVGGQGEDKVFAK